MVRGSAATDQGLGVGRPARDPIRLWVLLQSSPSSRVTRNDDSDEATGLTSSTNRQAIKWKAAPVKRIWRAYHHGQISEARRFKHRFHQRYGRRAMVPRRSNRELVSVGRSEAFGHCAVAITESLSTRGHPVHLDGPDVLTEMHQRWCWRHGYITRIGRPRVIADVAGFARNWSNEGVIGGYSHWTHWRHHHHGDDVSPG